MNWDQFQQPFSFDPSKLDDDHEIRFDYDDEGRLIRIRKERRMDDLALKVVVWVIGVLFFVGLFFAAVK